MAARTAPRVFMYHCRGLIPGWPSPAVLRLEGLSRLRREPGVGHPRQRAEAFVDEPQYQNVPFLKRPQAKSLDSQLASGDAVVTTLSEFVGVMDAGTVIGDWWRRGVRFYLSDLHEAGNNDRYLIYDVVVRIVQSNSPWAGEAESAVEEWEDEGPGISASPI